MEQVESNSPNIVPVSKKTKTWLVVLLIILFIILIGVISFLVYKNCQLKKNLISKVPESVSIPTIVPTVVISPTILKTSDLVSIDDIWNLYTNYQLGFSLKTPKIAGGSGPCVWKGPEQGDHSYRPAGGPVPVKLFEHDNGVYISFEYSYKLTGKTEEQNRSFFSGCEKYLITLDFLQNKQEEIYTPDWHIISEEVNNDQEIENFIVKYFQPGCKLGEKRQSSQSGVYDVDIKGDGKFMEESTCFINYGYVLKYAPEKKRIYTWNTGQSYSFFKVNGNNEVYDPEMQNSFTVLF